MDSIAILRLRRILLETSSRDANRQICSDLPDETETRSSSESRCYGAPREIGRAGPAKGISQCDCREDWHGILEVDGKPVTQRLFSAILSQPAGAYFQIADEKRSEHRDVASERWNRARMRDGVTL